MSDDMAERYRRAERFCEWNVRPRVRNVTVEPRWTGAGSSFWYRRQLDGGRTEPVAVDPATGGVEVLRVEPDTPSVAPADRLRSPNGRWDLLIDRGDLVVEDVSSGARTRLTDDAEAHHSYASTAQSSTTWLSTHRAGTPLAPVATWSPDSRRILTHRLDERQVPELTLLEMRPTSGQRPVTWTYRMPFMGDPIATAQLLVIDLADPAAPTITPIGGDPLLVEFVTPLELGWAWWAPDAKAVWFLREERGASSLTLCRASVDGNDVQAVITETADDYVEPHPLLPWPNSARLSPDGAHVVWPSERDGWRHLLLVDSATGEIVRRLTDGEWTVREILALDDQTVWFTGCGREPGRGTGPNGSR